MTPQSLGFGVVAEDKPYTFSYSSPQRDPVPYDVYVQTPTEHDLSDLRIQDESLRRHAIDKRRGEVLSGLNVRDAYIPTVHHLSGVVLPHEQFTEESSLSCGVTRYMPSKKCDGVSIPRHAAGHMRAGGCLALVLTGRSSSGGVCVFAHAARWSLLHKYDVLQNAQAPPDYRDHLSVIHGMVHHACTHGVRAEEMILRIFAGLPFQAYPHWTAHPEHWEANTRLKDFCYEQYGAGVFEQHQGLECLWLSGLARAQARLSGIGTVEIVWELPLNGDFAYTTHANPALSGLARNWVTVVRR